MKIPLKKWKKTEIIFGIVLFLVLIGSTSVLIVRKSDTVNISRQNEIVTSDTKVNDQTTNQGSNQASIILEDFIGYSIPDNWKKEDTSPYGAGPNQPIFIKSPDYSVDNGMGSITAGAILKVWLLKRTPGETLLEQIKNNMPDNFVENEELKSTKIAGIDGLNHFYCWEGCRDNYYVEKNDNYLLINYECIGCKTKEITEKSKYSRARDIFINSIKFK